MIPNPNYPTFRNHPFIDSIADNKKWTVSDNKKVPIDFWYLIDRNQIIGATEHNEYTLASLDTLNEHLPNASNYAYWLDADIDEFVVLDIEPSCPDDIKEKLLKINALYRETSLSGKGIHLICKALPDIILKYPDACQKTVFKKQEGWYEILLCHFVTFTGNQLPEPDDTDDTIFPALLEELASEQKTTVVKDVTFQLLDTVDTKYTDTILKKLEDASKRYTKKLEDFHGDHSRYEFGFITHLYRTLKNLIHLGFIQIEHDYTDSECIWFLYHTAVKQLDHRDKHDTTRNINNETVPWLLYVVINVIARVDNEKQKDKKED